jgi:hypothetical protein
VAFSDASELVYLKLRVYYPSPEAEMCF